MTLELHASPAEVLRAVAALEDFAQARRVPQPTTFALALALEECASNIVNHALQRDPAKTFQVTFEHATDTFIIETRDCGPAFDPTAVNPSAQITDNDGPVGGWGLALVRRCADEIRYDRQGAENVLRLTRRLDESAGTKTFR